MRKKQMTHEEKMQHMWAFLMDRKCNPRKYRKSYVPIQVRRK